MLETAWKWLGNVFELRLRFQKQATAKGIVHVKTLSSMSTNEFLIFKNLLREVHSKAFGEPLSTLPHGKAQALSWFIEESTGQLLSYKTLSNYVGAILNRKPTSVNPTPTTLAILIRYVREQPAGNEQMIWYRYRSQGMRAAASVGV